MSIVDHESSFQVDFPMHVVFDATAQHLQSLKEYSVEQADTILHKISVTAGVSLFSWGENITITFRELSIQRTEISILSTPKTGAMFGGIFDMGKNRKNINKIMQTISDALQAIPKTNVQAVGNSAFLFVCPHCGQNLNCPPELENVKCECPACKQAIITKRKAEPHA